MSYVMEPGECQVWWADRALAGPRLLELLDDHERDRWGRYRLAEDRERYVTAHALVRVLTGRALGLPPREVVFETYCPGCDASDHGKPRVAGSLEFSIAHSGRWSVVAIAYDRPIGVDVEELRTRPRDQSLIDTVLSQAEREAFRDGEREFVTYWTRKEALVKATGHGLAVPPSDITVSSPDRPPRLIAWDGGPGPVHLHDLAPDERHVGCLAALGDPVKVTEHDAAALLTT